VRLMQGRLGEFKRSVTARSYDALRCRLDQLYSKWLIFIDKLVEAAKKADHMKEADRLRSEYKLPLPRLVFPSELVAKLSLRIHCETLAFSSNGNFPLIL